MWKQPWGYKEGWAIGIGLFFTGVVMQLTIGKVEVDLFQYPTNAMAAAVLLLTLLFLHFYSRKATALKWFSGAKASITSMVSLLCMIIVMGLTRQIPSHADAVPGDGFARLGFMQMTVSWPFVLLFLYFLMILGAVAIRRISRFRTWRDLGFIANHAGLFIALFGAIFGSGDLQRLTMTVPLGQTEWRAANERNEMVELPVAVELKAFTIDEYPPKLFLLDNETGKALPERQPESLLVESVPVTGDLLGWHVEVTQYLPSAAGIMNKDTANYMAYHDEGATSAVYVTAEHPGKGIRKQGWVSCGNFMFPYAALYLDKEVSLVMPEREPKRFASEVTVYTKDGSVEDHRIEVNKPLPVKGWKIYQLSYDEQKGKWSRISVLEFVRDPWLPVVYAGILLMLAGSVYLFLSAPSKRN